MSENGFTGSIPNGIAQLPLVEELFLYGNALSGTIPTELQKWIPFQSFCDNGNLTPAVNC